MHVCEVVYIVLTYSFLFDCVSQSFNKRHLTYLLTYLQNIIDKLNSKVKILLILNKIVNLKIIYKGCNAHSPNDYRALVN